MSTGSIPPGPDENRGPDLFSVLIIFPIIATITVVLRLITRTWVVKNIGIEDACMVFALIFSWLTSTFATVSTIHGMGRHIWYLAPPEMVQSFKYFWLGEIACVLAFFFVKIAIALLLLRIMEVKQGYTYFLYTTMAVNSITSFIWLIFSFRCVPFSAAWHPRHGDTAHCIPMIMVINYGYVAGAIHGALDLAYVILPIYLVWNIQLRLQRKIGLTFLLGVGVFAAAAAFIKVTTSVRIGYSADPTWDLVDATRWNVIEANTSIAVGCIPPTRPLFVYCYRNIARRMGWSTHDSHSRSVIEYSQSARRRSRGWISRSSNTHPLELTMLDGHSSASEVLGSKNRESLNEKEDGDGDVRDGSVDTEQMERKSLEHKEEDKWRDYVSRQSSHEVGLAKDYEVADRV